MIVVGIDPGTKGAIAVYDGERVRVIDMPVRHVKRGKKVKVQINCDKLLMVFKGIAAVEPTIAVQEEVGGMPGQSGAGSFVFGWNACAAFMCLLAESIPHQMVPPATWKLHFGLKRHASETKAQFKNRSRAKASELIPESAHLWPLSSHEGRAEAVLIALYAHQYVLRFKK